MRLNNILWIALATVAVGCNSTTDPKTTASPSPSPSNSNRSSGGLGTGSTITSCGTTISTPGTYNVTASLTQAPSASAPCITIQNTSDVTLNCGGNTVSGTFTVGGVISANNVQTLSIANCSVQMVGSGGTLLNISNASNLSLTGDTLGNTASFVTYSNLSQVSNASVTGNTFNGALQMFYSTKSTVSNNIFLNPDSTDEEPYLLGFLFGSGNEAIGNQINGTQAGWFKGVDDGIILQDESGDTISNNVIKNNWDCGIEFTGNIKNTLITNNTISVYDTAAIGGWYYMSMTGSTISNNTANSLTGQVMLLFFRSYGLRAAGYDPLGTFPADTGVYFQNNIFSGNVANNLASPGTGLETVMELYNYLAYTTAQPQGGGTPIANNQFHISNNTFTGNNFGAGVNGPFFDPPASPTPLPADYVVDGGGNTCAAGTGTPVTCTP